MIDDKPHSNNKSEPPVAPASDETVLECIDCGRDSYNRLRCRNCDDSRQQLLKGN
jgi:hypothetical protein